MNRREETATDNGREEEEKSIRTATGLTHKRKREETVIETDTGETRKDRQGQTNNYPIWEEDTIQ